MKIRIALPEGDARERVTLLGVGVVTHELIELEVTELQLEGLRRKGYRVGDTLEASRDRALAHAGRGRRRLAAEPIEETGTEEQPAEPAPSEGEV